MRLAALIIGLMIAALIGFQSMSILTTPFLPRIYANAAATGVMVAIAFGVGAGFALSAPKTSTIAFGIAACIALAAGLATPYTDLRFWSVFGIALAVLCTLSARRPSQPLAAAVPNAAPSPAPTPQAGPEPVNGSRAAEADIVASLERLGRLHASGAISDEEFSTLKANLLSQKAN